jgi:hypothetical protein
MQEAAKAESGGRVASQPPRGATSTEQRSGKAQRLRVGWSSGQPPKTGQEVDPGADLWDTGQHLARGGADQTELQLKGNTAATW